MNRISNQQSAIRCIATALLALSFFDSRVVQAEPMNDANLPQKESTVLIPQKPLVGKVNPAQIERNSPALMWTGIGLSVLGLGALGGGFFLVEHGKRECAPRRVEVGLESVVRACARDLSGQE